jgi:hypothetical protein
MLRSRNFFLLFLFSKIQKLHFGLKNSSSFLKNPKLDAIILIEIISKGVSNFELKFFQIDSFLLGFLSHL